MTIASECQLTLDEFLTLPETEPALVSVQKRHSFPIQIEQVTVKEVFIWLSFG